MIDTTPFNAAEHLNTPEAVAAYIADEQAEIAALEAEIVRLRAALQELEKDLAVDKGTS